MTTYTQPSKNAAVYTNPSSPVINSFLLLQSGSYVLLQDGGKIIIGAAAGFGSTYTQPSKNDPSYSQPTKN